MTELVTAAPLLFTFWLLIIFLAAEQAKVKGIAENIRNRSNALKSGITVGPYGSGMTQTAICVVGAGGSDAAFEQLEKEGGVMEEFRVTGVYFDNKCNFCTDRNGKRRVVDFFVSGCLPENMEPTDLVGKTVRCGWTYPFIELAEEVEIKND